MSPDHLVSETDAERVRPFSFNRGVGSRTGTLPSPGPALAAIHLEQEVERRSRELTEQIRDEAWQAGFGDGAAAAKAEMESVIDALRHAVDNAGRSTDDVLDDLARSALEVGMAIAEAVVGKVTVEDPEALLDPIRRAIHELEGDDDIVVHLHPSDHTIIRRIADDSATDGTDGSTLINSVRIVDDATVPRGRCRVESATRIAIDGLAKRLDDIRRAVAEAEQGGTP